MTQKSAGIVCYKAEERNHSKRQDQIMRCLNQIHSNKSDNIIQNEASFATHTIIIML